MGNFDECLRQIGDLSHVYTQLNDVRGKNEDVYICFIKICLGDKKSSIICRGMFCLGIVNM